MPLAARCDDLVQCLDRSDQERCLRAETSSHAIPRPDPPAVVNFDQYGNINVTKIIATNDDDDDDGGGDGVTGTTVRHESGSSASSLCPETHFRCAGDGYCLPVYVRCNGVYDCPGHEDEVSLNWLGCLFLGCIVLYCIVLIGAFISIFFKALQE